MKTIEIAKVCTVCTKLDKNYLRLLLDLKITKLRSAYW